MQQDAGLHRRSQFIVLFWVGLVCAAASATLWLGPGILNTHAGGDSPFLLIRVHELVANLRAGIFPARWMPNAAHGLGYPFFNFYASLPYYLAGALNLLGFDLIVAIKLTQTLGLFGAAAAMWVLARQFLPLPGAGLAAVAYTLAPFHLVNIYVRGDSLSEFWAFVWYPVILWAVLRLASGGARRSFWGAIPSGPFAILVLSLAGLVLTHNVSAVLFAPFILIWSLVGVIRPAGTASAAHRRDLVLAYAAAAFLALCLSAWFWLPALGEAGTVQLNNQTTGYFNFANHFRDGNLVQPGWTFDYSVGSDAAVFAMGLVQAILIGAGIIAGLWRLCVRMRLNEADGLRAPMQFGLIVGCFVLATLLITSRSTWVWANAPLLSLAQFPWRFLSVQAVFAALLMGQLGHRGRGKGEGEIHWGSLFPFPLPLIAIMAFTSLMNLPNERLNVRAEDVTPLSVQLYEWHTGNIGTTIRAEYLPQTVQPWPRIGFDLMGQPRHAISTHAEEGIDEPVSAQLLSSSPNAQTWRVRAETEYASFVLPVLASAGWELEPYAETPAERAAPRMGPYAGSGWQVVELFGGDHLITLRYIGTPLQRWGENVSGVAVLICIVVFFASAVQPNRRWFIRLAKRIGISIGIVMVGLAGLMGVALGVRGLQPPAEPAPSMQALDNTARLFPHRGPLTLTSTDVNTTTYELMGATVTPTQLRAGEPFTLTLRWKDDRAPGQITVRQEFPNPSAYAEQQQLFRFQNLVSSGDAHISMHRTISEALPGPTLLRLSLDPNGEDVAGQRAMIVGPTITNTPANAPAERLHTFVNGITLHQADILRTTERDACFRTVWSRTDHPMADALQVSMRVYGDDGREIAQADWQPLAGLTPTWAWPAHAAIFDSKCNVPIANALRPNEKFTVRVVWYSALSLQEIDSVTLNGDAGPAQEGFVVLPLGR